MAENFDKLFSVFGEKVASINAGVTKEVEETKKVVESMREMEQKMKAMLSRMQDALGQPSQ